MRRSEGPDQIQAHLIDCKKHFGYEKFMAGHLPRSTRQTLRDCKTVADWPVGWERRYQAQGYIHRDPVVRHLRRVVDPFTWQEAYDRFDAPETRIVSTEARHFRLREGFCVPFRQTDGDDACISFGSERLQLSEDETAALHLVAIYALSMLRTLARRDAGAPPTGSPQRLLTAREVECLKWSAAGKSAWDISVILSISKRTVDQHLSNAAAKLQVMSRTQCVAEAIRRGIIA
jgi:LuxR family quorum sensing-dependent transcriptional regulator